MNESCKFCAATSCLPTFHFEHSYGNFNHVYGIFCPQHTTVVPHTHTHPHIHTHKITNNMQMSDVVNLLTNIVSSRTRCSETAISSLTNFNINDSGNQLLTLLTAPLNLHTVKESCHDKRQQHTPCCTFHLGHSYLNLHEVSSAPSTR